MPGRRWLQPAPNQVGEHAAQAFLTLVSEMLGQSQEIFI
jgi:hypothetical protein